MLSEMRAMVHPHVRGEYAWKLKGKFIHLGSSPRAWGIRRQTVCGNRQKRFIPTCVGNTSQCDLYGSGFPGSSPRAWGILAQPSIHAQSVRFIPTCVGNTQLYEYLPLRELGSSPRAWGILDVSGSKSLLDRFIPTCVGNTYTVAAK